MMTGGNIKWTPSQHTTPDPIPPTVPRLPKWYWSAWWPLCWWRSPFWAPAQAGPTIASAPTTPQICEWAIKQYPLPVSFCGAECSSLPLSIGVPTPPGCPSLEVFSCLRFRCSTAQKQKIPAIRTDLAASNRSLMWNSLWIPSCHRLSRREKRSKRPL